MTTQTVTINPDAWTLVQGNLVTNRSTHIIYYYIFKSF